MPTDTIDGREAAVSDNLCWTASHAVEVFPRPPITFVDATGRQVEIRVCEAVPESLVRMYVDYDPADRTQGLPPRTEVRVRNWLADVFEIGDNLVARADGRAVGHAMLVPEDELRRELAVFVASDAQGAGIGTRLIRTLLGHGQADGVERVWLTVLRSNTLAISLYRATDFKTTDDGMELTMERRL